MSTDLKNCPFCGGEAYFSKAVNGSLRNAVGCPKCHLWFETVRADYQPDSPMERDIVAAWNRRVSWVETRDIRDDVGVEVVREISVEEAERLKAAMMPMPEVATLRDQFAMAAMIADAIQSAVVSAAYIGQGKVLRGDYPGPETGAKDYYATADSMLEARK